MKNIENVDRVATIVRVSETWGFYHSAVPHVGARAGTAEISKGNVIEDVDDLDALETRTVTGSFAANVE